MLLSATSCTHITYESEGYIPIYLTKKPHHKHSVEVSGTKEFYLWGRVSPDSQVFLDELFYDEGVISVSELEIKQFQSLSQFFTGFFSLGFYIPVSYQLKGKGAKGDE